MVSFASVEPCVKNGLVEGGGGWWWRGGENVDGEGIHVRGLLVH